MLAGNTYIGATLHNKLINMQLHELKLDSTRLFAISYTGQKYPIKKQRGRYYIQHATGQLTVTPLFKGIPHDGSMADYVLNAHFLEYEDYESYTRQGITDGNTFRKLKNDMPDKV